jgi:hypothetical protein
VDSKIVGFAQGQPRSISFSSWLWTCPPAIRLALLWQSRCSSDDASRGRDAPEASRPFARHHLVPSPSSRTLFDEPSASAVCYVGRQAMTSRLVQNLCASQQSWTGPGELVIREVLVSSSQSPTDRRISHCVEMVCVAESSKRITDSRPVRAPGEAVYRQQGNNGFTTPGTTPHMWLVACASSC